jgi:hypothetical protein
MLLHERDSRSCAIPAPSVLALEVASFTGLPARSVTVKAGAACPTTALARAASGSAAATAKASIDFMGTPGLKRRVMAVADFAAGSRESSSSTSDGVSTSAANAVELSPGI